MSDVEAVAAAVERQGLSREAAPLLGLFAAVRSVLDLHARQVGPSGQYCHHCGQDWPCETRAAIAEHVKP